MVHENRETSKTFVGGSSPADRAVDGPIEDRHSIFESSVVSFRFSIAAL